MSWEIKSEGGATVVVLDSEMGIQNASEFHQAVLPPAVTGSAVRVDASATKTVHSSIMQILYALSQAVPDFGVTEASEEFCAAESRIGLTFTRSAALATAAEPLAA